MSITVGKIKEIIKEIGSRADIDTLKDDISLVEQGLDSLDMINMLLCLEENLGIKIPDEDINNLKTINKIVNYINQKRKAE